MLKKLLIVLVVLVAVAAFLLLRDWDSPDLGQRILAKTGQATGIDMTAKGFRFNLTRGLVLESFEAESRAKGRRFQIVLDRLVFEHRLLPLLSGTVAVDRIVLEHPQIVLEESNQVPPPEKKPRGTETAAQDDSTTAAEGPGFTLDVKEILIRDGSVEIRSQGSGPTRLEDLDLAIRNLHVDPAMRPALQGLSGNGRLAIRQVSFDTMEIRDAESDFSLAQGRFDVKPLRFTMDEGPFNAEMQIDLSQTPLTYRLSVQGDPLDFNAMVGAQDKGFGPGRLTFDANGRGTDSRDLKGKGALEIEEGNLPSVAALQRIEEAVGGSARVVGEPYKATKATFRVANNVLTLDPFSFETEKAKMTFEGRVDLGGPLDLGLSMGTPREGVRIEGVGDTVLDVLADEAGWVMIPIQVSGTLEEPRARPDAKALLSQAGQGTRRMAEDAVKGLLKKKKKQP